MILFAIVWGLRIFYSDAGEGMGIARIRIMVVDPKRIGIGGGHDN